ncbi:MAG: transcriptional repressor NrdR [Thermoleophilaceae bacterium]|jgi:transcriptional repressor NrdR|nr:transcriptional repressor NrdR [Thermoleophilaceae bacterium]MEA2400931.1 transcriptional repressor NrdR [Thermoleophilaceae bacterium]MEA2456170.1 transcriptional repressor NrdR [Thermoleophilaceae bacterium]
MLCSVEESSTASSKIIHVLCPFCSSASTQVIDTRPNPDGVRRRRECTACGERFTTHERAEEPRLDVIKRDGRRERFDRQKLVRGLARAAGGRPVTADQLDAVAAWIAEQARQSGGEAQAERIGDLAERGLARVDPVSAIQFASVYRNLADLDQLEAVVRRFKDDPLPGEDQLAIDGSVPSGPRASIGRSREISSNRRRGHVPQQ